MHEVTTRSLRRTLSLAAAAMMWAGCSGDASAPAAPDRPSAATVPATNSFFDNHPGENRELRVAAATMRRATAKYHDVERAKQDGFVFLHGCEIREEDKPVGTVYVNVKRLLDGIPDPSSPDGLIYQPLPDGRLKLVAVEFAIPFTLWNKAEPPTLLGATFQREDEFGVFGLHAWVWLPNPRGLFAETNPRVSC